MTARKPRLDVAAYRAALAAVRDDYRDRAREAHKEHNHAAGAARESFAMGISEAIELLDRQTTP